MTQKKQPPIKSNWATRFIPSFIARAFGQVESNPKAPEHGASWSTGNGVAPVFSPRQSMAVFGKHAYSHACVTRASQDIASLPIKLLKGQGENTTEITDHELLALFNQPSSITDGYLFREQFIVDLMMTGNCYTLIVGDLKKPTSLYRLHPENVRIIPDPVKMIQGYEYSDGGSSVVYAPERVVHIRNASWDNGSSGELYGSGIVEALNEEITADINAQRMASSVSKQGRPDVLLSPIDPADIWDRRRRQEIMQAYKGMTENGGAMALSGQIKVETLTLSPRDLEFQSLRTMVRENISAVCGVPSTVLGLPDANYATARQATITYWEIQEKRAKKLEQFMTRIARLFDPAFHVQIDFHNVDALQFIRTEKLDRITLHMNAGMTASEAYAYEGLTDSPFRETELEEASQTEETIEQALSELLQRSESQKKNSNSYEVTLSFSKSMTKVQKDVYWKQWMQKSVVPAERTMKRATEIYLEDASARYARRAEKLAQAIINQQQNKAINYTTILGRAFEIEQIGKVIGRAYRSIYLLTGNDTVTNLYNMTGKTKPLDLLFGERAILERQILEFARQINATNEKQIKRVVRSGIEQGLSNAEIGEKIRQSTTFSQARAQRIAQTETTKAINTATNESYKQFEKEEDVKVLKEWISSRDDKVRETHAMLDDEAPIPVDNDFNVDGYSGPAPASFGVAAMDINCRCTIAPVIIED